MDVVEHEVNCGDLIMLRPAQPATCVTPFIPAKEARSASQDSLDILAGTMVSASRITAEGITQTNK